VLQQLPFVAAFAGALAATLLAVPADAVTLREELVRAGVAPPAGATDLDREITSHNEEGSSAATCSFTTDGGSRTTVATGGGSCDPGIAAALFAAFPAPGATWVPVAQPFWPRHRVFELATVGDPRWYHRPTVALDPEGGTHLLTDSVSRVPRVAPLEAFNAIAAAERPTVDASSAEAYAAFFLRAHVLYADETCLAPAPAEVPGADLPIPAAACSETPGFRLTHDVGGFLVETVLVHRTGRWSVARSFHVTPDGRVRLLP
jgi:hypothetical protein